MVPNQEKKIDYYVYPFLSQLTANFDSKNGGKWSFSYESKALIHLSHWEDWIYGAQSLKEKRLLC